MKSRKEIKRLIEKIKKLEDHYTDNRYMVLYNSTDIREYVVETEEDYELVTVEDTFNALKDLVIDIYNEYDWDDDGEWDLDEVRYGIDSMFNYYKMVQPTEVVCDENGNPISERTINIYDMQKYLKDMDDGVTAIKDLIKTLEKEIEK